MGRFKSFVAGNLSLILVVILLLNLALRCLIYLNTTLFSFSDYTVYLRGVEEIRNSGDLPLTGGNFLFTLSYLGYFAKYVLGSISVFYFFNCLLGTLITFISALIVWRVTQNKTATIVTALLLTFYTEFIVFSSVFYTPLIMMLLVSLIILLLWVYLTTERRVQLYFAAISLTVLYLLSFFFKQELLFLPLFLFVTGLFTFRKVRKFSLRIITLSVILFSFYFILNLTGTVTPEGDDKLSNSFIFFGHTDYGGDGGEGSFVYPDNEARYEKAVTEYFISKGITQPDLADYNDFQTAEIVKYITHHPFKWASLQFTKFFRTFGVVPETTSFKVLYTGLFNGNLWLTSAAVVAPVTLIIIMFIVFFNLNAIRELFNPHSSFAKAMDGEADHRSPIADNRLPVTNSNKYFLSIYLLLFLYYLLATVFFGQYQERYRMPLIVLFIIPAVGYFIASFSRKDFYNRRALIIKGFVVILFLIIWIFQAEKAISNKERFNNAIELIN